MANYEKFKQELLADPSAKKGHERHQAAVLAGELVREWRKSAGMTQAQLAAEIGTSQEAISKIESAAGSRGPHIGTLAMIAEACGLVFEIGAVKRDVDLVVPASSSPAPETRVSVHFAEEGRAEADRG